MEAQRGILRHLEADVGPLLVEHDRVLTLAAQALELDLPALISSENLVLASRIELIVGSPGAAQSVDRAGTRRGQPPVVIFIPCACAAHLPGNTAERRKMIARAR